MNMQPNFTPDISGPTPFGLRLSMPQSRRDALRMGLFSMAGMMGACRPKPATDTALETGNILTGAKAKSVIQVFLWGGMSHNDTWDPKPDAGSDYNGPMRTFLKTNVDGIQLSSWFPKLAQQADKYSLIRSMTHRINGHETAAYMVQTAHAPGERLAYPSVGAVFTYFTKDNYKGVIPPYVVLTRPQGRFSEEGFLGPRYKPFATGGDPNATRFEVEGIISKKISDERQGARRDLLGKLNTLGNSLADNQTLVTANAEKKRAYDLILGEGREVFDLTKEKPELRNRYGRHTFGQDCLAARRMVEAGVPYIVINYPGGWDTHSNHFQRMGRQCPQLDQGLAVLLEDLKERGLLDSTLVWCCGEFGRGPKIDWQPPWNGGRNHYGAVFSALVAGGGFKGGQVVGESDAKATEVKDRPVYPVDLLGSIYQLAGIDLKATLPHPMGLNAHVLPEIGDKVKSGGLLEEIM
jgi:hypothetical protein